MSLCFKTFSQNGLWYFRYLTKLRSIRIAKLLIEELILVYGVPEALLSDRGTNLLSHLMMDICGLMGIQKLNTTAYHPQCDGMVERFNRTLKMMLRKHATKFGPQWDQFLPGVLWAYRNVPHSCIPINVWFRPANTN
jgi:transposase InsO family protein